MALSRGLKIDMRRKKILDLLAQNGEVRIGELAEMFDTTEVTIRSDLSTLESDGYLQRVTGGAVQTVRNLYNLDYIHRSRNNLEFKRAVGMAAAERIHDGETLMINAGVTTSAVASILKSKFKYCYQFAYGGYGAWYCANVSSDFAGWKYQCAICVYIWFGRVGGAGTL